MKVEFLAKFSKDIDAIGQKSVRLKLLSIIEQLEQADDISELAQLKKLTGHKSAYRIRIGDYRAGFFLENNKIIFARIVHRKEIYRLFP